MIFNIKPWILMNSYWIFLPYMETWAAAKERFKVSVAVPPAPVEVPSQWPHSLIVTSVRFAG
jgi:hypothetical protein